MNNKSKAVMLVAGLALASTQSSVAQQAGQPVEKKSYNYSEWTKGLFSEAVTVTGVGNAKLIYLGGIGAEEEQGKPGQVRSPGDINGQCKYTFEKIGSVLQKNGAGLKDIVKMTSYLTDSGLIGGYISCRNAAFRAAGADLPAETLLVIRGLAWPDMILEVDVDAVVTK